MSSTEPATEPPSDVRRVSLWTLFSTFLVLGATSFGGGVVGYLRETLVTKRAWLDDDTFIAALEISETLPGLNATNMSVIVGDHLRGPVGAIAAFLGMTLPGTFIVFTLGVLYGQHGDTPNVVAALNGVGAAAVGILLAVTAQLGRKQLGNVRDLVLVVSTFLAIGYFRLPLALVLAVIAPVAIWLYRPKRPRATADGVPEEPDPKR